MADILGRDDPSWQRMLQLENSLPQIKVLGFAGRLTETRVFIDHLLAAHSENKESLLAQMMVGLPEILTNSRYVNFSKVATSKQDVLKLLISEMEKLNREKIDKHRLWIMNQGLVIYCTVLDIFLENALDAIFRTQEKLLYGLAAEKTVDLKKLLELGSVEAAVNEVRAKEIKIFSYDEIGKRFRYLKSKLKIDTEKIFIWENSTEEMRAKLKGWNLKHLEAIYENRHSVVHRDQTPIADQTELDTIADFSTR